jgi:hypothetical protein
MAGGEGSLGASEALRQRGAAVAVRIWRHRQRAGDPPVAPVEGTAIIDTGSSTTAISFEAAARLKLDPVGKMQVGTGTDIVRAPTFAVSITFPGHGVTLDFDEAPGLPFAQPGQVAILGRDVLARAVMRYDGPSGEVQLVFVTGKDPGDR